MRRDLPELLGFINYLFVWGPVHQIGVAWRRGAIAGPTRALVLGIGGLVALVALTEFGPYPVSMVGVPGQDVNNTQPPSLALVALALTQMGFLLALEPAARRLLARTRVWAATVLVNSMIMSIYLWHLTVMVLVIGASVALGGIGLRLEPTTATWWWTRPLWLAVLTAITVPSVLMVSRFERVAPVNGPFPSWRPIAAAVLVTVGLALLALGGIADGTGILYGLRVEAVLPPLVGAALLRS